ncbi:hypothetical protein FA13DRAFT_1799695 [Coprinellus micaceus]|uniref:Uncharacterized protein n=1 Tax=Coprinellus micaceus TaxID=71717 RepID=A0A4Y7SIZ3_COPMI|nr:hypothetical protein FA13DRAFT_1799695 [Coprinellus micaceus]
MSFVGTRSPSPVGNSNAIPSSRSQTASPCSLAEVTLTNPRLHDPSSPDGDMDSDEESTPGHESSLDVSLAKRKTPPQGSSTEGPPFKKSKTFCKRCARKHGRECVLPPGGKACVLCAKSKKSCSLGQIRRPRKVKAQRAAAVRTAPCGETTGRGFLTAPRLFVGSVPFRPTSESERGCMSVPRLVYPSTLGGNCSRVPLAAPPSNCPAPRRETSGQESSVAPWLIRAGPPTPGSRVQTPGPVSSTVNRQSIDPPQHTPSSQESSVAPWLIRAAPPTVAPTGLKITPDSQVKTPGPVSSPVNRQSTDRPTHPPLRADNLSGASSQPDTLSLAVLHPHPLSSSTSGAVVAHPPHLPFSLGGDMQRLRLIIAEAGYILAGTQMGECGASPYGPGPGDKACTCGASLSRNQGGSQAGHGHSAARYAIFSSRKVIHLTG